MGLESEKSSQVVLILSKEKRRELERWQEEWQFQAQEEVVVQSLMEE